MPSKVRKVGRVKVIDKDGLRHHFEVSDCDGILSIAKQPRDWRAKDRRASKAKMPQSQDRPPVEEPPNQPGKPPVKEPPPKDPNRQPPQKPPVRAGQETYLLFGACALGLYGLLIWLTYEPL